MKLTSLGRIVLGLSSTAPAVFALQSGPTMTGLGLAGYARPESAASGSLVAFEVWEWVQGADLNGDGDLNDHVLHVYDHGTGLTTNVGEEVYDFQIDAPYVAFLVWEGPLDWMDLNGDGDILDSVAQVFDARTGALHNTGLACGWVLPATPREQLNFSLVGKRLLVSVIESAQGNADLNGNGTTKDWVPHVFDIATSTVTSAGIAMLSAAASQSPPGDGRYFAFLAWEWVEGDLNGDGDSDDSIVHVIDAVTGTTTNLGLAAYFTANKGTKNLRARMKQGWLAFIAQEGASGNTDLNGDGDALDFVLTLYRPRTGQMTHLGDLMNGSGSAFELRDGLVAYGLSEKGEGATDLNGDGDAVDTVVHVHEIRSGTTLNTGRSLSIVTQEPEILVDRRTVAFVTQEWAEGADLNGDGDFFDEVAQLVDATSGVVRNTGLAATNPTLSARGQILVLPVWEGSQGLTDLNGDGDSADVVPQIVDTQTGTVTNVGRAVSEDLHKYELQGIPFVTAIGGHVVFAVDEFRDGKLDLNGDGDFNDDILHVYDTVAGTLWSSGLSGRPEVLVGRGFVSTTVSEQASAQTDLNGDGDTWDDVMHVIDLPR